MSAYQLSGDFPVQLATRLPDWSAGGLPRFRARLSVCRSPNSTGPTRTTYCGHPREDVTRKMLPWSFTLTTTVIAKTGLHHNAHLYGLLTFNVAYSNIYTCTSNEQTKVEIN